MNTRNTLRLVRVNTEREHARQVASRRLPRIVRAVRVWWLRLRIRWTQEEINDRMADGSLSAAQHRLWRECISNWRSDIQWLEIER